MSGDDTGRLIQKATVTGIEHFVTQMGGKVQCDVCGFQRDTGMRWKQADELARLAQQLRAEGWVVEGDHVRHVCPDCAAVGTPTEKP